MLLLTDSAICFPKVQRVFRLVLLYNNWVKCRIFHWLLRGGGGGGGSHWGLQETDCLHHRAKSEEVCSFPYLLSDLLVEEIC